MRRSSLSVVRGVVRTLPWVGKGPKGLRRTLGVPRTAPPPPRHAHVAALHPIAPAPTPPSGPSVHAARLRSERLHDELRTLARAYGVRASVFVAEELDSEARFHTMGYEIELSGRALPLLQSWYGGLAAVDMVRAALLRIAGHVLAGPCPAVLCNPYSSRPEQVGDEPVEVRLRIGLYEHDHPLDSASPREQGCVRTICERLAELAVWPPD
ncbi:MAG: hypothetical protein HY908_25060 [Myxococcales bacterium]|nr:hypothetical protein [Myxococcales bacterium]